MNRHDFVFIGVRTDSKSRPIAVHEWCKTCGCIRSTRFTDGDEVYLSPGPEVPKDVAEVCRPGFVLSEAKA